MSHLKKIPSQIAFAAIVLLILALALPTGAKAATSGDLTYEISGGTVTITDCSASVSGELVIPDTIEGYPVTAIGDNAFEDCTNLTAITIPQSVTSIGTRAFARCTGLTAITIPDSVTTLSGWAFYRCSGLTTATISGGIETLDEGVFSYCSALESVSFPDSVTSIGWSAFQECTSLKSVVIPKNVTMIDEYAFAVCSNLSAVTVLGKLETVGESAFYGCPVWHVLLAGSEADWNAIQFGGGNTALQDATRHFGCSGNEITDVDNKVCTLCNPSCTHTWDEGKVTKEATCKDTGIKTYTCTACGETKTEEVAKTTVHTPGAEATETTPQLCTVCGAVLAPATGAQETTVPPTTEPPVTEPPVTEPPATEPPATEPPATEPATPPTTAPAENDGSQGGDFPVVVVIVIIVIAALAAGILFFVKSKKKS